MQEILAFMQNPAVLFGLGVLIKYVPKVRTFIANRAIPYVNIGVALLGGLLQMLTTVVPPDAVPSTFTAAAHQFNSGIVFSGFFSFLGNEARGFWGVVGGSLGSAAQAYLLNRLLLHEGFKTPKDSKH
jgi:hypothetical protein